MTVVAALPEIELVGREVHLGRENLLEKVHRDIGRDAQRVIQEFYSTHLASASLDRERLEASVTISSQISDFTTKWNRQDVYLDSEKRQRAQLASSLHLAKHRPWLENKSRLSLPVLRDVVAVQHYIELDLEDICLAQDLRRSQDSFCGDSGHVSQQLLLDATRSCFIIEGEVFDFAREQEGCDSSQSSSSTSWFGAESDSLESRRQEFFDRLVVAITKCLGGDPSGVLLRAITTSMSQSGLANIERACEAPQIAVSGGESDILYELTANSDSIWDLKMSVHKHGFEHCMVYSSGINGYEDPRLISCKSSSSILKEARVRFSIREGGKDELGVPLDVQLDSESWLYLPLSLVGGDGASRYAGKRLQVDVQDLRHDIDVFDARGRRIPGLAVKRLRDGRVSETVERVLYSMRWICGSVLYSCSSACTHLLFRSSRLFKHLWSFPKIQQGLCKSWNMKLRN